MYPRLLIGDIQKWLPGREILIIYGARQVGKTTLLTELVRTRDDAVLLNCEIPAVSSILESSDLNAIRALFGNHRLICLDEAQKVTGIGRILKLIYDELPGYKIIATGSSSFELAEKIVEPLTGRNIKFRLFPLSLTELEAGNGWLWVLNQLNQLLIYGSYPGLVDQDINEKQIKLAGLSADYLYQDILIHEGIRHPSVIKNLLKALALQVGAQVSLSELSGRLGISRQTVDRYIDLLEKCFIIFRLPAYSGNLRNEIRKSQKIFFIDNGLISALTGNFSLIQNRSDAGALWENFCVSERVKRNGIYAHGLVNMYFWRSYDGAEIDLIEEHGTKRKAFEFKWNPRRKASLPKVFKETYPVESYAVITPQNVHLLKE